MTPEVEQLRVLLDGLRASVLKKLAGGKNTVAFADDRVVSFDGIRYLFDHLFRLGSQTVTKYRHITK